MLIYESEGFIETQAEDIIQLSRSVATVCFGDSEQAGFNVHAVLCQFKDGSQERCQVAFHSKVLKRALVFSVKNPDNISALQNGEDILAELGFSLEKVNLRLSPAMQEVVLRDVPGVATPDAARKHRRERSLLISELQKDIENDPDSPAGKKAALKLASEERLDKRTEELQQILTALLSPQEVGDGYSAAMDQVRDLTERLENTEKLLDEERKQREMSESITEAAEKRIQELEEILVDVETKNAGEIKQKQRAAKLKARISELEEQISDSVSELEREKKNQEQFVVDVKSANEQIATLEEKLNSSEKSLADTLDSFAELESKNEQFKSRITQLEDELESAMTESSTLTEVEESYKLLQEELQQVRESLAEAQEGKGLLADKLSTAEEKIQQLQADLETSEDISRSQSSDHDEEKEAELASLREDLERETSVRKRLERGASEDDKRIKELEESLEQARQAMPEHAEDNASEQVESLKSELHELKRKQLEEQGAREELEHELEQAHKMVDSLEKMVRETAQSSEKDDAAVAEYEKKIVKLETKNEMLTEQLEQERARQDQLAQIAAQKPAMTDAEEGQNIKRPLRKMVSQPIDPNIESVQPRKAAKQAKPLPHELRPPPKKSDFFRPDWDLQGLPCQSVDQVVRAWETVFNVQIALDGYPSQFCMAFLVVLKVGKVKKLYMVFRLKQSKYTLVKVPTDVPKNEDDLKKAINEGLRFLKSSGFEMDEMPKEYIENTLGSLFLEKE